ncbi:MAG: hypothetical protein QW196_08270 [Sulfolobales archaeon]
MVRQEHVVCPRCGNPGKLIAKQTPHNVYYYVYHSRKKMCYIGPQAYIYTTRLHDFELRGAHDSRRYVDYLNEIVDVLTEMLRDESRRDRDEILRALEGALKKIERALQSSRE